jgi:molybdate transport system regulatory protein
MEKETLGIRSKLWIVSDKEAFLGDGRIALLQTIKKTGSISKAAIDMNMSYLKAWKLIDSMNKVSDKPMVIRTSGGKGGGGSTLTESGENAIKLYRDLNIKCQKFLNTELKKLLKKL